MILKRALIASVAILTAVALCLPTFAAAMEWKSAEIPYTDYFGGYIGSISSTGENDASGYQITSSAEEFDGEIADPENYVIDTSLREKVSAGSWHNISQGLTPFSAGSMIYSGSGGVDVGARSGQFDLPGAALDAHVIVREDLQKSSASITSSDFKVSIPQQPVNYYFIYDPMVNGMAYTDITLSSTTNTPGVRQGYTSITFNFPVMMITSIDFYICGVQASSQGWYIEYPSRLRGFRDSIGSYIDISVYNTETETFDNYKHYDNTNYQSETYRNGYYYFALGNYRSGKTVLTHFHWEYDTPITLTSGTSCNIDFSDHRNYDGGYTSAANFFNFYTATNYISPALESATGQIVSPFTWYPYTDPATAIKYTDYTFRLGVPGTQNQTWQFIATVKIPCDADPGTELKLSDMRINYVISDVFWQYDSDIDTPETDPGGGDDPGGPSGPGFTEDTRRVEGMDDVIGGYDDIYKPDIDISGQDVPGYSGSDLSGAVGLAAALGKYSKSVFVIPKIGIGLGISIAAIFIKHILKTSAD